METFNLIVPEDFKGSLRLDKYVSERTSMNRSQLKSGLLNLCVNGKKVKVSFKVRSGDRISFDWEETVPIDITPEDLPLDILYEDDRVCVINKSQGMVVHPAAGNWSGTLVNALLWHWGRSAIDTDKATEGTVRPGIVHRLDKDTSGIIITAKNRQSEEWLSSQFRNHKSLKKEYIAICMGRPPQNKGKIVTQLVRDPRNRKRFKAVENSSEGKTAITYYKCIACYGDYSLMRLRILTGRTHQIRVHMKYLNCPVLGDSLYSKPDKLFPKASLMLHARRLKICLPGEKKITQFDAPTPERFLEILSVLHKNFKKDLRLEKNIK